MALVDIFIDRRPVIGTITIDASVQEIHEHGSTITDHPVELGADVSDHIIDEPVRVQMEGVVSDSVRTPLDVFSPTFTGRNSIAAWQQLLALRDSKIPFALQTSLRNYTNMVIERISATRSLRDSNVLRFTADLRKLVTGATQYADALAQEVADLAGQAADLGAQGAATASPELAEAAGGAV